MTAASHADPHARAGAPQGHEAADGDAPHGSLRGYVTGFLLSVILTAIPFWLVMAHVFKSPTATAFCVMALAAVQVLVHMVYFLHMTPKSEGGWNLLALIFTLVLVTIAFCGSVWVMYHLNYNMMPTSPMTSGNAMSGMTMPGPAAAQDARTMP